MDLTVLGLFALGLVLLVAGAELLVRGASRLAAPRASRRGSASRRW